MPEDLSLPLVNSIYKVLVTEDRQGPPYFLHFLQIFYTLLLSASASSVIGSRQFKGIESQDEYLLTVYNTLLILSVYVQMV